jgi:hypothetical protein
LKQKIANYFFRLSFYLSIILFVMLCGFGITTAVHSQSPVSASPISASPASITLAPIEVSLAQSAAYVSVSASESNTGTKTPYNGTCTQTYSWSVTGPSPGTTSTATLACNNDTVTSSPQSPVSFQDATGIDFTRSGTYQVSVTVTDTLGNSSTEQASIVVPETVALVTVNNAYLNVGDSLSATVTDIFGNTITDHPVTWSMTSKGNASVSTDGILMEAPLAGEVDTVTATCEGVTGLGTLSYYGTLSY